jgi:hypothetical protein
MPIDRAKLIQRTSRHWMGGVGIMPNHQFFVGTYNVIDVNGVKSGSWREG